MIPRLLKWAVAFWVLISVSSMFAQSVFQPDKMETVLYGVAYYPEYMPYERLDKDVELMQQAGITVVRMGESSWGLWEPEDGQLRICLDGSRGRSHAEGRDQGHHGHADVFHSGVDVQGTSRDRDHALGRPAPSLTAFARTPICSTPRTASIASASSARSSSITKTIRQSSAIRSTTKLRRPAPPIMTCRLDSSSTCKRKFKTVDELNKDWGLNYWGQRLNDWTEIPPQDGIINPGWKLEWERYSQWITTDFLAWQASIVNEYKRPDQFVTQDFAGPPRPEVNEIRRLRRVSTSSPPILITARRTSSTARRSVLRWATTVAP